MHGLYLMIVVLMVIGLVLTGAMVADAADHPGYGAIGAGAAVAVAILVFALVHLRIFEQKMGLWPDDKSKK
jgi:tellurite resistance protein TehA-like permease